MINIDNTTINSTKNFLTNSELLAKVKSQNLIVDNELDFFSWVDKVGYDNLINGYRLPFGSSLNEHNSFIYYKDANFNHIITLYNFDFDLKLLTFKYTSIVELKIKNELSNIICQSCGVDYKNFLKLENFKDEDNFKRIKELTEKNINSIIIPYEESVQQNIEPKIINHSIIDSYINANGTIPFWSLTQILTLGDVVNIICSINNNLCSQISRIYKLQPETLQNYLLRVRLFRNVCAHQEKLYNYKTINRLKTKNIKHLINRLNMESPSENYDVRNYKSLVIVFKMLLSEDDFSEFCREVDYKLNILELKLPAESFRNITLLSGIDHTTFDILAYQPRK